MTKSSDLRLLGERIGILPEYVNYDGTQRVVTSDDTYKAIFRCMGYAVDDNESIHGSLQAMDEYDRVHVAASIPPGTCVSCAERTAKRQLRGIWTNLYTIRSETNWGVGDFGDLRQLIRWAGDMGLAFVAVNPLHALRNRGHDVSPYRPVSRLYRNEIYLEIETVSEFEHSAAVKGESIRSEFALELLRLRASAMVDYEAVSSLKRAILKRFHRSFQQMHGEAKTERGRAYREYLEREGTALREFATFMVLDERFESDRGEHLHWRNWPDGLNVSRSAQVQEFRREHADEVDFHCYVQFELDRQLAALAQLARESGLEIGLFGDLAIGTAPDGSDPWAFPELFICGASIGAPPDDLGPAGQNWGLPPVNPRALRNNGFEFWKRLLRNNLTHCGALRIDHVMGLLRQFWIPDGFEGSEGAYIRFPAEDLFAILAQESRRSGTIIVGEDLGTVPEGFRELLQRFGVLSTRVVHFERDWDGAFKPSSSYPPNAYVVVGTHDMAPLAGFATGRDLAIRRQIGLIGDDAALADAVRRRRQDWNALKARLTEEGFEDDNQSDDASAVGRALIGLLAKTPACLVGMSLDDLAGEREPVNIPGVGQDRHASWSRKMLMPLEEILASQAIRDAIRVPPVCEG